MTTWYREDRGGEDRGGDDLAFSVRPDLWPPGSHYWSRASGHLALADWAVPARECYPDEANGAPGVAEALILAGQVVRVSLAMTTLPWVEIPDPRTKGAP